MPTEFQRCVQHLRNLALFAEASEDDLCALASATKLQHVERNKVIAKPGDACDGFHIVIFGRVKLSLVTAKGMDKPLQFVEPGGSFGDITMLLNRPYYLAAKTTEDSLLAYTPRQAILQLIEKDSHFALRMLASLSWRMRAVVDDIESFSLQPPAVRIVTYLLRHLPEERRAPVRIELNINKNVVAAHLNLTAATLSRYFKELTDNGLVSVEGRVVLVHDIEKLEKYMQASKDWSARVA